MRRSSPPILSLALLASSLADAGCGPDVQPPANEPGSTSSTPSTTEADPSTTGSIGATSSTDPDGGSTDDVPPGAGFVDDPDLGDDTLECSTFTQNCPAGFKCAAYATDGGFQYDARRCVPVADDPGGPGDPCTVQAPASSGIDDCELGTICWSYDESTLMGTCTAWCEGDEAMPVCDDPSTSCSIAATGILALCFAVCDPLDPDCDPDEVCVPQQEHWECVPGFPGDLGYGSPCDQINACAPGLVCVDASTVPDCGSATGCCTDVCDLSAPSCMGAAAGSVCQPWFPEGATPVGFEDVGVCALP